MKVLVCGGRDYADYTHVKKVLDRLHKKTPISLIINGQYRGADAMSSLWAAERKVDCHEYPADWIKHGRAAGPIRNQQMLDEGKPDLVIAFPGGDGTNDMIKKAKLKNLQVIEIT